MHLFIEAVSKPGPPAVWLVHAAG